MQSIIDELKQEGLLLHKLLGKNANQHRPTAHFKTLQKVGGALMPFV
jgi:hypothetical protein